GTKRAPTRVGTRAHPAFAAAQPPPSSGSNLSRRTQILHALGAASRSPSSRATPATYIIPPQSLRCPQRFFCKYAELQQESATSVTSDLGILRTVDSRLPPHGCAAPPACWWPLQRPPLRLRRSRAMMTSRPTTEMIADRSPRCLLSLSAMTVIAAARSSKSF